MLKKSEMVMVIAIILGCILVFGAFRYYQGLHPGNPTAVITQNNKIIQRIDLNKVNKPYHLKISGDFPNTIYVEKNRIRFEKSDCPNQICVNTGWLEKNGDIAVCLPNKVIVAIENN